jgi:hypothetical protein
MPWFAQLRRGSGLLVPADQPAVAKALVEVLNNTSIEELRVQAALALSDFTEIDGVLSTLGAVALAPDKSIDLRYATCSVERRRAPLSGPFATVDSAGRIILWKDVTAFLLESETSAEVPVYRRTV